MTIRTNGQSLSAWLASTEMPQFPPLPGAMQTEVCVIGGGIAGLTTAYLLAREGRRVVLLEAFELASGESGRTTAQFAAPDEPLYEIEKSFGEVGARHVAQSFKAAIDLAESIVSQEGIDCEFERLDGYLYCEPGEDPDTLAQEEAAAKRAGWDAALLPQVPGLPFNSGPCVRYPHLAQVHPVKYLAGLAQACRRHGVEIHCGTRATAIEGDSDRQTVKTERGDVTAGAVVVATNTPFNTRMAMHTKQAGYRTYVIAVDVPRGYVPRILLWDNGDPYYYVRLGGDDPASTTDLLIVGAADHKVGQDSHPQHRYDEIEQWVRRRFPVSGQVVHRWSGQVMEPSDGVAYFGRSPGSEPNQYMITGDSGNGMTHCSAGAIAVTDMIMGRPNEWAGIFDPSRKPFHGKVDFIGEQANTFAQYKDLVTGGDVSGVDQIPPGQGAVIRQGLKKLAVYRDEASGLHVRSAVCTHLGCVVAWNSAERSWDCPCHGSRFGIEGEVLHGPAATPLAAEEGGDATGR
jgi:glycine/D-amino acid oxidase-like deaminating enzyme/nitrite reductase/ring-hydroxylating ferredoxin subunit